VESSRTAVEADVPRVAELAVQLRRELAPMKGGDVLLSREALPEPVGESYRVLIVRDDTELVVGEYDGVVVGYAAVALEALPDGRALGVLTDLYVEPDAREVGVGEAMIEHVIAWCDARHCIGIDAVALPGHRAAKNFFEEFRFTARALVMHRRLGT
jgi:GNAT superfamily N-acetyltransferase